MEIYVQSCSENVNVVHLYGLTLMYGCHFLVHGCKE